MAITVPISQIPNGVVPTIAALRAINVSTISDGSYVTVLGSGSTNDGYQNSFTFSGACVFTDNGSSVISTPTTGAWIRCCDTPFVVTTQSVSYSGIGETFVLLSGGSTQITYTLPPSYIMFGQTINVKLLSTGAVQIRATGADSIFPITGESTVAFLNLQDSGAPFTQVNAFHFQAAYGIYYQV